VPAAAAVISGVEDALRDFDVRIDEAPISPLRLFELIRAAKGGSAHARTGENGATPRAQKPF